MGPTAEQDALARRAPAAARRHALVVGIVWAVLTVAGIALVLAFPLFGPPASREGEVIDHTFLVLLLVSVPVFVLVQVVLVYSALRFRDRDGPDGPPISGSPALSGAWVAVTLAMVLALGAFGWAGMNELHVHDQHVDVTVRVVGTQFAWRFDYGGGVGSAQLRLPKDRLVRLELESRDVLHSFWVPALRVKQDAVPGRVIAIVVTPTETGQWNVLCAELCGVGHTVMRAPVEVMEQSAFDAWVGAQLAAVAAR